MIEGFSVLHINDFLKIDPNDEMDFDEIIYSDTDLILIKKYNSEEILEKEWKNQMYFVSGYIQRNFEKLELTQQHIWNTYIVYLINCDVSTKLKLEIENNKFCCKKNIIDIKQYSNIYEAISNDLPSLTSINVNFDSCNIVKDENSIKNMFIQIEEVEENIKNYFSSDIPYLEYSKDNILKEMVGLLNE